MKIIADIVMLVWIPAVLVLFMVLPPRRAVITAFLAGFLFLPMASYGLSGLPDYTKMSATCGGILLGALLFDSKRVISFRPGWVDLPVVMFCLTPFASSMVNGLGLWDGVAGVMNNTVTWGFPYLIGRVYFRNLDDLRELAIGIFIGGLVYIPFCLFEIRMSPQLHNMVYGINHRWGGMRLGGWRPSVFLDSGLQLGMWMAASSMAGFWLWRTGSLKRIAGVRVTWLVWALIAVTILCRSTGALALGFAGVAVLLMTRVTGTKIALLALLLMTPFYIAFRTTGLWHGEPITALAEMVDADRAQSFQFRIDNEDILIAKALQEPVFGWGGWGRSRVYDEWGKDISITDGLWVIELGTHGLVGLLSLYAFLMMPLGLLVSKFPAHRLISRDMAPACVLAIAVTLSAIDYLVNGMINPVLVLASGATVGVLVSKNAMRKTETIVKELENSTPFRRLHPGCP